MTIPKHVMQWVYSIAQLTKPQDIYYCNGSQSEYDRLASELVQKGTLIPLEKRKNSFLARSDPSDVARVEDRTFICTIDPKDAGNQNHWVNPDEMRRILHKKFTHCMNGRTMYVIPFSMGPIDSTHALYGIEITDSAYVVLHMHLMTRVHPRIWEKLESHLFVPCVHSVGHPLGHGEQDVPWPCNPTKYISHFPETMEVWSFGSGYGGNALLGKKCLALRLASFLGKQQGWFAEHMFLMALESPHKEKMHIAGAFPSSCGKTNLAMLKPPKGFEDWRVTTLGDDIVWVFPKKNEQGKMQLHGLNPEAGLFGVAPGTNWDTNPHCMETLKENVIFTNVAMTQDGDVWWEGLTNEIPSFLTDWRGRPWTIDDHQKGIKAAHPNSRFTVRITQCPCLDSEWDNPLGVPIDAIIIGGRRRNIVPLVTEARDWKHGVYLAATLQSETTSAQQGKREGILRYDPFAMLPFLGYDLKSYFERWIRLETILDVRPQWYQVNWFRRDANHGFLWPGFQQNIHVLQWIYGRWRKDSVGIDSPYGIIPRHDWFPNLSKDQYQSLFFDNDKEEMSIEERDRKLQLCEWGAASLFETISCFI